MTAKIFEDILNHAFFSAYQVNLLIFDECHAAVKDAPMKQVMEKLSKLDGNISSFKGVARIFVMGGHLGF